MNQELLLLLEDVERINAQHEAYLEEKRFNFFTAMHKERAEVQLHSRFISYLLSPSSGHSQKDLYLKIFVRDILHIHPDELDLENCTVIPNEQNKSEFENIDILIINKRKKQAIIIENKIDAGDSNKNIITDNSTRSPYTGQLERYYTMLKTGKTVNGKDIKDFQCNDIIVFYLSIDGRPPSDESIFSIRDKPEWRGTLSYASFIIPWLEKSIERTPKNQLLVREFIQHYLNLIKKMTHNDITIAEKLALKETVAKNISGTKFLIENFKHVKWHTTHEFWTALAGELKDSGFMNVELYPSDNFDTAISQVTHMAININYGINFTLNGKEGYISGLNNLSWGIHQPKCYKLEFANEILNEINFSSFSNENTYRVMDNAHRKNIISALIEDIKDSELNGFTDLIKI